MATRHYSKMYGLQNSVIAKFQVLNSFVLRVPTFYVYKQSKLEVL